jgi:hypothetical protein
MPQHILNQIGKGTKPAKPLPIDPKVVALEQARDSLSFLRQARAAADANSIRVAPRARFTVFYQFQEGHTNAVRHPVRITELL